MGDDKLKSANSMRKITDDAIKSYKNNWIHNAILSMETEAKNGKSKYVFYYSINCEYKKRLEELGYVVKNKWWFPCGTIIKW